MNSELNLRKIHAAMAAVLLSLAAPAAIAQETAEEPAADPAATAPTEAAPAEAAPADAAPADASATSEAPAAAPAEGETVATIPVPSDEPAVEGGAPRYPYTFAAARMVHVEYDDVASDGFGVEGSWLVLPQTYAIAGYVGGSTDETTGSVDTHQFELGAGYRQELGGTMELNAGLRLLELQTKSDTATHRDELGYRADVGVRATLLPKLEGNAAVWYIDAANNSHAFLAGSALYEVLPHLSFGAEAVVGSSTTSYSVLGRWAF